VRRLLVVLNLGCNDGRVLELDGPLFGWNYLYIDIWYWNS
jgi:hypothetical protein